MEHLHAYWRMDYIRSSKDEKDYNPFKNIGQTTNDRERLVIFRSQFCCALLNKFPYNPGHMLIVPYESITSLLELSDDKRLDFFNSMIRAQSILTKAIKPDGFNVGFNTGAVSGGGVQNHLHAHVVPRWQGDSNFMPIIANTRVLPESLDKLWEHLVKFV